MDCDFINLANAYSSGSVIVCGAERNFEQAANEWFRQTFPDPQWIAQTFPDENSNE
jgi:hypothetical protein